MLKKMSSILMRTLLAVSPVTAYFMITLLDVAVALQVAVKIPSY